MKLGKSQRDRDPRSVVSIAVVRDGRILWLHRADNDKLTMPGGHLEPGEEPLDGAHRELREETGFDIPASGIEYLGDAETPRGLRVYAFLTEAAEGEPTAANDPDAEAKGFSWLSPEEVPGDEHMTVPRADNITLRFLGLTENRLAKREPGAGPRRHRKEWRAEDGLRIPHHSNPLRQAWDRAYQDRLTEVFAGGDPARLRPVTVPITATLSGTNAIKSQPRHRLYQRMLAGGDRVPPLVVRRNGISWHVIDGNHRAEAALKQGVPSLDAYELLDADHPDLKKVEQREGAPPFSQGVGSDEGRASGYFWPASLHRPTGALHVSSADEPFHGGACAPGDGCAGLKGKSTFAEWDDGFILHPQHQHLAPGKPFFTRDEALAFLSARKSPVLHPDWDPYAPGAMAGALQDPGLGKAERKLAVQDLSTSPDRKLNPWPNNPDTERRSIEDLIAHVAQKKTRIREIASSSRASAWPARNGHRVVVGRDPHNREQWRATGIGPDGTPYYHLVGRTHEEALDHAVSMGADIHAKPLHLMKSEETALEKMAMRDLGPGAEDPHDRTWVRDYSHLLSPPIRRKYRLEVQYGSGGTEHRAQVLDRKTRERIGYLEGALMSGRKLDPWNAKIHDPKHRGLGIGKAMYQALYAHAFHHLGVRTVEGDVHSSMAHQVHRSITRSHGLEGYEPQQIGEHEGPHDEAYGPYEYHLKSDLMEHATASLDDALRRPKYRGNPNRLAGHCYVASEALWHLMGGSASGWVPQTIRHEGDTHWYLKHRESGQILDPTAGQFQTPVPYEHGRGCGFLTKHPSKRAAELMERIRTRQALPLDDSENLVKALPAIAGALAGLALGGATPVWTPAGLHPELLPIAHLESGFGRNVQHQKGRSDYDTAHGALGLKPGTAHEAYLASPALQQARPGLKDPADFTQTFKADPGFYNLCATAHYLRLRKQHGSPDKAAYAWRWGSHAAAAAHPDQVAQDPYVQHYRNIAANAGVTPRGRGR